VWEYADGTDADSTWVRAVKSVPVESLIGKVVGQRVRLANGELMWALIGNLDAHDSGLNEHFVTLSIESGGKWFHLARYHDHDSARRGPEALSHFLSLKVDDVFPIYFDVREYVKGSGEALTGTVERVPRNRLSRADLIALSVP
jgi:hypothetical protein